MQIIWEALAKTIHCLYSAHNKQSLPNNVKVIITRLAVSKTGVYSSRQRKLLCFWMRIRFKRCCLYHKSQTEILASAFAILKQSQNNIIHSRSHICAIHFNIQHRCFSVVYTCFYFCFCFERLKISLFKFHRIIKFNGVR